MMTQLLQYPALASDNSYNFGLPDHQHFWSTAYKLQALQRTQEHSTLVMSFIISINPGPSKFKGTRVWCGRIPSLRFNISPCLHINVNHRPEPLAWAFVAEWLLSWFCFFGFLYVDVLSGTIDRTMELNLQLPYRLGCCADGPDSKSWTPNHVVGISCTLRCI
jgi:hypothetical protein